MSLMMTLHRLWLVTVRTTPAIVDPIEGGNPGDYGLPITRYINAPEYTTQEAIIAGVSAALGTDYEVISAEKTDQEVFITTQVV